ncbi:MIP family channel protein [Violaceomyces palustris]|uniref:MIP family channel protein n=1 Tax=Violaceomyces palustris TaxID=1673888 RepID=A0ACD0P526_9BASI|nr:MIP family channel protein [Violaceomyces palustris]
MSERNPLLANDTNGRRSSAASLPSQRRFRPSFSLPPLMTRGRESLSREEVHPDTTEPLLPATAIHANESTRLHKTRWSKYDAEPNAWAKFRHVWREEFAEFWGAFMILLFGAGVECQVNLHYGENNKGAYGTYLQGRFAWAAGVAIAVWVSGGISGGHCNPTVTIVLSIFRGFPARKIPSFIIAQVLGCTAASLLIYANYKHSISIYEGGEAIRTIAGPHATAPFFFTFPASYLPWQSAYYSEFLASATLIAAVFALSDKGNLSPPKGTMPFAMFIVLLGIGASLGFNTGYAMNGARDTGPRIALWLVGYGNEIWTHNGCYWLWAPWIAAITGGIAGGVVYDAFCYTGRDSPFNRPSGGTKNPLLGEGSVDEENDD